MLDKHKVLILDAESREAVSVVRSLGHRGISPTLCATSKLAPAFFSKYADECLVWPTLSETSYIKKLLSIITKDSYEILIPLRDFSTFVLSKNKALLSRHAAVPVPDIESLRIASDKYSTIQLASELKIPTPKTFFEKVQSFSELEKMNFPLVLKPRHGSGSRGVVYVHDKTKFEIAYRSVKQKYGVPVVQEFVFPGGSFGVSMLFNHGELRALFTHKRLREYPLTGGPSTLRMSTSYPEIENYAVSILKALKWHGVAMVEFRVDACTKEPKLMEINPRFWGSLPLAITAGIDFPYLLYRMTIDGDIEPVKKYRLGVKARWLVGDTLWFLAIKNLAAASEFLRFKDVSYDIESFSDPLPAIASWVEAVYSLINRSRREYVFARGIEIR